jgi:hypothetical protein
MNLDAELILEISCDIAKPLEVGRTSHGFLRVIPITGGTFRGRLSGTIVPGGADWNTLLDSGVAHVFAKYTLQTDDGEYISVQNEGYLDAGGADDLFKTTPRFQTNLDGRCGWLSQGQYAGTLRGRADNTGVEIQIYKLP